MKNDRARVQLGRISPFGLLELSRQRLRPSLLETSFEVCPACSGAGLCPTTESTALSILRRLEEEGIKQRASALSVAVPPAVALYLLNQKRRTLLTIEDRYGISVGVIADDTLVPPEHRVERLKPVEPLRTEEEPAEGVEEEEREEEVEAAPVGEREDPARRNRRRRSRRRRRVDEAAPVHEEGMEPAEADEATELEEADEPAVAAGAPEEGETAEEAAERLARRRRRRGKRGGRRRTRGPVGQPVEPGEVTAAALAADAAGVDYEDVVSSDGEAVEHAAFTVTDREAAADFGETGEAHADDLDADQFKSDEEDEEAAAELAAQAAFSTDGAPEPTERDDASEQRRRRQRRSRTRKAPETSDAAAEAFKAAASSAGESGTAVIEIEEVGGSVPSLPEPDTDVGPEDWREREDELDSRSDSEVETHAFEIEELGGARGTLVDEEPRPGEQPVSRPFDRARSLREAEPVLASGFNPAAEPKFEREPEPAPAPSAPAEPGWSAPKWALPARKTEMASEAGQPDEPGVPAHDGSHDAVHDGEHCAEHDGELWRSPAAGSGDTHEQAPMSDEPERTPEPASGPDFLPDADLASAHTFAPSETRGESREEADAAARGWSASADGELSVADVETRPELRSPAASDEAIRAEQEARPTEVIRVGDDRHVGEERHGGGPRRGWWQRLLS